MKKKAYISPETEVVKINIECLMGFTGSGEVIVDPNPDEEEDDNHSRRHRDVWEDEEEW